MSAQRKFSAFQTIGAGLSVWKVLLFAGVLFSILWAVYFSVETIFMPYQIEMREGTALVTTRILLNGENPFSFENQPLAMTNYGIGYNLVVLPFAALFGNTLLIHRAVTFAFILLSAFLCTVVVYRKYRDISAALACAAFVIVSLAAHGGVGAFPSAMGTYLFLAAILLPYLRSFDFAGLFASAALCLLAFFAKAYFVLAFGIVAAYLFLFVSKKGALIYSVGFLLFLSLSLFAVRAVFPLYFINTVVGNMSNTYRSFGHLLLQLRQLFLYFYPTLILALFVLGVGFWMRDQSSTGAGGLLNLSGWQRPLIVRPANYLLFSFACSLLAFLLILGSHMGAYMNYAYQLLVPLFFCWFFHEMNPSRKFRPVVVLLVLFNLFLWEPVVLDPLMLEQKNSPEWAELYDHVRASKNVLNAPLVASELVELGLIPIDAGQSLVYYNVEPYPDLYLIGPPYSDWETDGYLYTRLIDRSIERKKFDLVVTTKEKAVFFHVKRLPEYYSVDAELVVKMPQTGQTWTVLLWKPQAE